MNAPASLAPMLCTVSVAAPVAGSMTDGAIDGPAEEATTGELGRGMRMALPSLPARRLMVLEITQAETLEPLTERADLAVAEGDVVLDPATGAATLTVHNIGARDAGPFAVPAAREGPREQAAAEVSGLPAPQGYAPSRLQVALAGLDLKPGERVVVTLDAEDALAEIAEDNNTAVLTAVAPQAVAQAMHPVAN